jgi:large subunit ribosomal protein L7/L12
MNLSRMLLRLGIAAFVAIMLAGPGSAVFPSAMRWGAWAACPAGTSPAPERFRASYSRPGETDVRFLCVSPDGQAHDRTLAAMGGLFVMYFVGLSVLFTLMSLRRSQTSSAVATASTPSTPRSVPPDVEAKARALVARKQLIEAIKIVRAASGMGLKEAKDWVDALPNRPPSAASSAAPPASVQSPGGAAERLIELKRLLDAGLITQAEFDAKRGEILARI